MTPKYRATVFLGITSAIMAPFLGFVMYYSPRFPSGRWPVWFTNTVAVWFIANFLLVTLLTRRVFKKQVVEPQKTNRVLTTALSVVLYLVILWSGFFVYGVIEAVQGKIALNRAIPAGAFLLFFVGIFGWSLYRSWRRGV
jgi:hypothetical protein